MKGAYYLRRQNMLGDNYTTNRGIMWRRLPRRRGCLVVVYCARAHVEGLLLKAEAGLETREEDLVAV